MLRSLRNIAMKSGGSLHHANFQGRRIHRDFPEHDGIRKLAGDVGGAETIELAGPFHSGGSGIDKYERLTGLVRDENGNQLYFYSNSDKAFTSPGIPHWPI
ncbi:hypothetical protein DFH07DRAFT_962129 [Mycena maculata]|uniref:Uncharacterized protein n=1 Tax=Mycena maculata TaxID=230809 RepID=A0AAD7N7G3_9AGAR|nr:hypothetical protein DFH07DRAFT_962129 [Mycena maculata]